MTTVNLDFLIEGTVKFPLEKLEDEKMNSEAELSPEELIAREKEALRDKAKGVFSVLAKNQDFLDKRSVKAVEKIVQTEEFQKAKTVLLYSPIAGEVDIRSIVGLPAKKLGEKKSWVLPRAIGDSRMLFFAFDSFDDLKEEKYGIQVPKATNNLVKKEELDFIIVPGVMFTRKGKRLGRGGGYYDRLLSDLKEAGSKSTALGLCFEELIMEEIPFSEHDFQLKQVIVA